jgi:hypothetical protein
MPSAREAFRRCVKARKVDEKKANKAKMQSFDRLRRANMVEEEMVVAV